MEAQNELSLDTISFSLTQSNKFMVYIDIPKPFLLHCVKTV